VRLDDDTIAYQQARLRRDGERWLVEDIMGWRDTYVDEEPLTTPRELHGGEVIRLGLNALRFEPSDDDRAPPLR
jgi:pSer/pThr/pTyr-binding forkhead associated (FHA) protein